MTKAYVQMTFHNERVVSYETEKEGTANVVTNSYGSTVGGSNCYSII